MRFNKLDLNQLVVLDALLNEKSVKRAAEKVFLSPAATSCALDRLRDYFEDELLQQLGKTMVLTARAEGLQKPVRDVLLQIQAIDVSSASPVTTELTAREREIAQFLVNGKSSKQIAIELGIGFRTVESHPRARCASLTCRAEKRR